MKAIGVKSFVPTPGASYVGTWLWDLSIPSGEGVTRIPTGRLEPDPSLPFQGLGVRRVGSYKYPSILLGLSVAPTFERVSSPPLLRPFDLESVEHPVGQVSVFPRFNCFPRFPYGKSLTGRGFHIPQGGYPPGGDSNDLAAITGGFACQRKRTTTHKCHRNTKESTKNTPHRMRIRS